MKDRNREPFLLFVNCMTYCHAPYIQETMDGFTMQQTTFPYVCIIVDDCSPDDTGEVIKQYMEESFELSDADTTELEDTEDYSMTFARHKYNRNCYFAVYFLKYNHYRKKDKRPYFARWTDGTKYQAFCEGDDYWTDPHKLEMQVSFLEALPDYGMCYTDFNIRYGETNRYRLSLFNTEPWTFRTDYSLEQWILSKGYAAPMTWVVRYSLWNSAPRLRTPDGTYVRFAYFLKVTKAYCFRNNVTAVYRILKNSASHSNNIHEIYEKRILGMYQVQQALINLYFEGEKRSKLEHIVNQVFFDEGLRWFVAVGDQNMLEKASLFYKKEKDWRHVFWLWVCSLRIVTFFWKLMFKPLLRIRRYSTRQAEYKRAVVIN